MSLVELPQPIKSNSFRGCIFNYFVSYLNVENPNCVVAELLCYLNLFLNEIGNFYFYTQ